MIKFYKMIKRMTSLAAVLCLLINAASAQQISVTSLSQTYFENFDGLATSGTSNSTLPNAWYSSVATYRAGDGSANNGALYSFGEGTNAERSIGSIGSGSATPSFGVKLVNNTGSSITKISLSFLTENWRLGQEPKRRIDSTVFSYNVGAGSITDATGWVNVSELNLVTPDTSTVVPTSGGKVDGNVAPNRKVVTGFIDGLAIADGATFWLRWTEINVSGSDDGLALDSLTVTFEGGTLPACTEPANSVTNVVLSATGLTSVEGTFTAATADGYLVALSTSATAPAIVDATNYNVNQVVDGATIISKGTATTFSKTGLTQNTIYYAHVFPFNNSGCTGGPNYKITAVASDSAKTLVEACPEPANGVTNLTFTAVGDNQIEGKFTKSAGGADGYIVLFGINSSMPAARDSATYAAGDSVINGSQRAKVAYVGADSAFTISGLNVGTRYHVVVFPYNTCPFGPNYKINFTVGVNKDDTTTTGGIPVCAEPDTITGITVTGTTDNSISVSFTPHSNAPSGYLVVYRKSSSFLVGVNDGTTYTVGQLITQTSGIYTDSSYVGYIGNSTSFTLTGLDAGVTYHFAVFPYNNTSCSGGPNYKVRFSNGINKTSGTTTGGACVEPNSVPQNLQFTAVTANSITGKFNKQSIADGYVIVVAKGFIATLTDGTNYSVGDSVGNSPKTYIAKIATTNTDTTFTISGLQPNTNYSVAVYSYKDCSGSKQYKTTIVNGVNKRDTTTQLGTGVKFRNVEAAFSLFPNPAKDGLLYVKFDNSLREDAIIQIVDVLGRSIYAEEIPAFTQMRTIPVNNLSKGTYFLNVVYKGTNNVSTFIVE